MVIRFFSVRTPDQARGAEAQPESYELFRRSENKNLVGSACLQREFSRDVRLHGVWVLRDSDWECILSERESILVADAVADDVWGGILDEATGRDCARGLCGSTRPACGTHSDADADVAGNRFDRMHTWVRNDRVSGSASCVDWAASAGIFRRYGIGRGVGLFVRDCYTGAQRLLRQLAVGQPAGVGYVRRACGGRAHLDSAAAENGCVGMARSAAARLRDHTVLVPFEAVAARDGRVCGAEAPADNIGNIPFADGQLDGGGHWDADGHDDDRFLLHDYGLHADVWQLGVASGKH